MDAAWDVIIAGLGAMGSAAAFHLARRGVRVLGLDRFQPPHTHGSSHGRSRIIREAYFEHPDYVPLLQRAYALWDEAERLGGRRLFHRTGGLMISRPGDAVFAGARRSAVEHGLAHEVLGADAVRRRFPGLRPDPDMQAVLEPRAGFLLPERCIEAHLELARRHGARLRFDAPVQSWSAGAGGVEVRTADGVHRAGRLLVTAGSWVRQLLPGLGEPEAPFAVERQVLFWFTPARPTAVFDEGRLPVHLWQYDGDQFFYGFPDQGDGVKVAFHHRAPATDPDTFRREVDPGEVEAMRRIVRRFLPEADGPLRETAVCKYTLTPDQHFWIDWHPRHGEVLVASPCSGHGFKFAAVIGEGLADLLTRGGGCLDRPLFRRRTFP